MTTVRKKQKGKEKATERKSAKRRGARKRPATRRSVPRYVDTKGKTKLHLACGKDIKRGYINVDIVKLPGIDFQMDITKVPYPFRDNSMDVVEAHCIFEHLLDYVSIVREVYRILRPGGKFRITVPHFSSPGVFTDPTHYRGFTWVTFDFFVKGNARNYYFDFAYSKVEKKIGFYKGIHFYNHVMEWLVNATTKLTPEAPLYEYTFWKSLFPAQRLYVTLTK